MRNVELEAEKQQTKIINPMCLCGSGLSTILTMGQISIVTGVNDTNTIRMGFNLQLSYCFYIKVHYYELTDSLVHETFLCVNSFVSLTL